MMGRDLPKQKDTEKDNTVKVIEDVGIDKDIMLRDFLRTMQMYNGEKSDPCINLLRESIINLWKRVMTLEEKVEALKQNGKQIQLTLFNQKPKCICFDGPNPETGPLKCRCIR